MNEQINRRLELVIEDYSAWLLPEPRGIVGYDYASCFFFKDDTHTVYRYRSLHTVYTYQYMHGIRSLIRNI